MKEFQKAFVKSTFFLMFDWLETRDVEKLWNQVGDKIISDIDETADKEFNKSDVHLALQRVLKSRILTPQSYKIYTIHEDLLEDKFFDDLSDDEIRELIKKDKHGEYHEVYSSWDDYVAYFNNDSVYYPSSSYLFVDYEE